ncbi:Thioredoxin [Pseudomonas sp. NFACC02]|uniref:thioredoxin family protein n=1 Tax=Pseudomonas sp. NFACC02 TaxID=1566250 RepID=UPI0008C522F4|nr:thioredoxin family protein [Pseudomonas sp. NFACC02]SEQ30662.1 Thioredoxin [Pseudomonas sp. NFACC02]
MLSYQELFEFAEDFDSFVRRGLPPEIGAVNEIKAKIAQPDVIKPNTLQRLRDVKGHFHLLVAGEMWCPDCQINVTVMDYLQRTQPKISLGVITKGRAENELKQRLNLERISIPFVLVLNEQFQPVGRFIERPRAVIDGGDAVKPDYRAGAYLESTVQDLLDIFETAV